MAARLVAAAAVATSLVAAQDTWLGLTPASGGSASLIYFDDTGRVQRTAGTLALNGETVQDNAFRCGVGFCLVATATGEGACDSAAVLETAVLCGTAAAGARERRLRSNSATAL